MAFQNSGSICLQGTAPYSLLSISFYFTFFTYEKKLCFQQRLLWSGDKHVLLVSFSSTFLLSLAIQKVSIIPTRGATGQNNCLDVHMMYPLQWSFPIQDLYAAYAFPVQPTRGTFYSPAQTQPEFCKCSAEKTERTVLVS